MRSALAAPGGPRVRWPKPGVMVRPVELFATPWARTFNGQLPDGVACRAVRLELVAAEAAQ